MGGETEGRREGLASSPPAGRAPVSQHPGKPEAKGGGKRLEKLRWCLSPYNCEGGTWHVQTQLPGPSSPSAVIPHPAPWNRMYYAQQGKLRAAAMPRRACPGFGSSAPHPGSPDRVPTSSAPGWAVPASLHTQALLFPVSQPHCMAQESNADGC